MVGYGMCMLHTGCGQLLMFKYSRTNNDARAKPCIVVSFVDEM